LKLEAARSQVAILDAEEKKRVNLTSYKQQADILIFIQLRNAYYCTGLPAKLNPGRGLNHRSAIGSKQQEDHIFELIGPCTSQIYLG
jgi:hypothetical protein